MRARAVPPPRERRRELAARVRPRASNVGGDRPAGQTHAQTGSDGLWSCGHAPPVGGSIAENIGIDNGAIPVLAAAAGWRPRDREVGSGQESPQERDARIRARVHYVRRRSLLDLSTLPFLASSRPLPLPPLLRAAPSRRAPAGPPGETSETDVHALDGFLSFLRLIRHAPRTPETHCGSPENRFPGRRRCRLLRAQSAARRFLGWLGDDADRFFEYFDALRVTAEAAARGRHRQRQRARGSRLRLARDQLTRFFRSPSLRSGAHLAGARRGD